MPKPKASEELSLIGKRIEAIRKERGMTRYRLAQETGISAGTIKNIEIGKQNPAATYLLAICKALDVETDYILGISSDDRLFNAFLSYTGLSPEAVVKLARINRKERKNNESIQKISVLSAIITSTSFGGFLKAFKDYEECLLEMPIESDEARHKAVVMYSLLQSIAKSKELLIKLKALIEAQDISNKAERTVDK